VLRLPDMGISTSRRWALRNDIMLQARECKQRLFQKQARFGYCSVVHRMKSCLMMYGENFDGLELLLSVILLLLTIVPVGTLEEFEADRE